MTDYYGDLAAELHRIADAVATLAGGHRPAPHLSIDIQPGGDTDEAIVAEVDAVATALLGRPGETYELHRGSYHHGARSYRDRITIAVYNRVADPATRERDAELARLRAQVAALGGTLHPVVVVRDETAEVFAAAAGRGVTR